MKTKLILVCALILLVFSCSSAPTVKKGVKLYDEQKYTEAIAVFEKVLEKNPENEKASYNIAISYIQLKDDDKALIYLNRTVETNPYNYDAWYNIAIVSFQKGDYEEAILASFNSGKCESNTVKNSFAKLFNQQKYTEVIQVFEKVLEKDPKNADALYNIAISYIQLKDNDKALIYLNKTVEIRKLDYDAWYNIAFVSFQKGDYKKAIQASLNAGKGGGNIVRNSFAKLKEAGFPNRDYAQLIEKDVLPHEDFVIETDELNIYFTLSVSKDGKVNKVSCGHEEQTSEDQIDKKVCEFYLPFLSSLEFIPAYNFAKNELKDSDEIGFITLNKDKNLGGNLSIVNEFETAHLKTAEKSSILDKPAPDTSTKSATSGKVVITGAIDKSVIDAYIQRNLAKIRKCYEKELMKNSDLDGRIVIYFIIGEDGSVPVAKVSRTTMNDEIVETCVADQIKKIKFPAPRGGAIVMVNYPFVFKHSEG